MKHGRKKVTLAHKANILKYTQGLFLDVGRELPKEYEGRVEYEDRIIDATAMLLVMDPYRFDVIVCENMFGDILSDQIAGLVGGLGLAPGGNIAYRGDLRAVHGSAPTSPGRASPTRRAAEAAIMMLQTWSARAAERIRNALGRRSRKATAHAGPEGHGNTQSFADA